MAADLLLDRSARLHTNARSLSRRSPQSRLSLFLDLEICVNGIVVGCGDGVLRITRLQKEGAKPLAAAEFLAGTPLPVGAQLG